MNPIMRRLAALAALSFLLAGFAAGQDDKKDDPPKKKDDEKKVEKDKPGPAAKVQEALNKLKEAEDEYRKARREAAVALDAAIAESSAAIEKAYKQAMADAKDNAAKTKAMQARQKALNQLQELRTARMRLETFTLGPAVPPTPPEEGRLHAKLDPVSPVLASHLKLEKGKGMVVAAVLKGGPADKAGLRPKDVLVEIDGKAVPSDLPSLRKLLAAIKPGTAVTAAVMREGKREEIKEWTMPALGAK